MPRVTVDRTGNAVFDQAMYRQSCAASLCAMSRQHFAKLVASGEIRVVRSGRMVLVPATEIARLLEGDGPDAA